MNEKNLWNLILSIIGIICLFFSIFGVQQIATRMVIQYGWGPDDSPAIYHHSNAVFSFLQIQK